MSKLTHSEIAEEVDWLMSFDVSPELIVQELKISPKVIYRAERKFGDPEVAKRFDAIDSANAYKKRTASK